MTRDIILAADLGGTPLEPDELAAIPDFAGIRREIWSKFPGAIARKEFRAGEVLFREGENGTTAFYLLTGTVEVRLNTQIASVRSKRASAPQGFFRKIAKMTTYVKGIPDGSESNAPQRTHIPIGGSVDLPLGNPIATLEKGEIFGELAALAAFKQEKLKRPKFYPRSATVQAKTDIVVLEMLPNILNNVLYNAPAFKEKLNRNYRNRALDTHLRSVPMFQGLTQEFIDHLREKVELVDCPPGQEICRQGEVADAFYMIRLGFVKVSQHFPGGEMVLTYLSRGSYFGEMGLLPPGFRVRARGGAPGEIGESVIGAEPVVCGRAPTGVRVLPVPWDEYISRDHFELQSEGRQLRVTRLPTGKNPLTFQMQPTNTFLANPGESFVVGGTTFEVLEDPQLTGRRTATCTPMDFVQLVRIKAEDFARMLAEFPEVKAAVKAVASSRQQMNTQMLNRVQTTSLQDFLKQELMQAQNLLLLDLDKCTRCDECVKACVATHSDGVTRLIREGVRFEHFLVPTSCRACMDPLCMTRCPVGAIRRKQSLDIVIEDWCIGCGNCASDCPYGTINIVDVMNVAGTRKAEPRPKAVTCDLCVEYREPNCVRACPHDAAVRVEPKSFFAGELAGVRLPVPVEAAAPPAPSTVAGETRIFSAAELLPLLPRLKVLNGTRAGAELQLRFPATTIGRGAEADYRWPEDENMSRVHCSLVSQDGRFILRDNNSTNGTFVNGDPIAEVELYYGDVIQAGEVEMEFLEGRIQ